MTTLTLAQANEIIEAALKRARELKIKPLAVVVLDEVGHLKAAQRKNAASMFASTSRRARPRPSRHGRDHMLLGGG